ncbi:MAG: indolepyruvate ferredoxin oxidoreductase subunit alpha [Thermoplasmataceae archaeon]|jgi:indolepyruvate ferredoxin oxidoreductase alpha subunit
MSYYDEILEAKNGQVLFLLGNEAVARGAIESGLSTAATYPGTPSSEVGDLFYAVYKKAGMHFEYSVNEKVALEVAFASSSLGLRSMVFMKHVGMNVASDAMMSIAYTGTRGGLVIMTADDPSMHSSQNEQDNRHYADLSHLPLIEPSTPQEAKDFISEAFEISEKYMTPVIFRTTTMISHERGLVEVSSPMDKKKILNFESGKDMFNSLPQFAVRNKKLLEEKISRIKSQESERFAKIERADDNEWGAISSGAGYAYLKDVVSKYRLSISILKIGMTNPLPEKAILNFVKEHPRIIIVEELDPYLEEKIRALCELHGADAIIYGKMNSYFPYDYEFNMDVVRSGVFKAMHKGDPQSFTEGTQSPLVAPRTPVLCSGCPHRASFFAVRRALKLAGMSDAKISSDIGCYSLGAYDPYDIGDYMISMGSSIGIASGLPEAASKRTVTFIGDSTFFHSGIPGLINAKLNNAQTTLIILDNRITAMTGQQPNPGSMDPDDLESRLNIPIENVVKGIGITSVVTVDPFNLGEMIHAVNESFKIDGPAVIISRRECAILRDAKERKAGRHIVYMVDEEKCSGCGKCVEDFACPAISFKGGKASIDPDQCDGCGVCSERYVCPFQAIEVE